MNDLDQAPSDRNLTHLTPGQERYVESHAPYMKVFWALLVLTVMEYAYARFLPLAFLYLVMGLVAMAVIKATLVGMYFMHLKFEGRWIFMMLIPVGVLATALVLGLMPDMVLNENADPGPAGIAAPEQHKPARRADRPSASSTLLLLKRMTPC